MTRNEAREILSQVGLDKDNPPDFHTLNSQTVFHLLDHADANSYRKYSNANGSRGRYFYAMLTRKSRQEA